jgi:hypothetical protein
MADSSPDRLKFGPNKYSAFHLLMARWLRHHGRKGQYCYVTLGGTELRDILSVRFMDYGLISKVWSYENDKHRLKEAQVAGARLAESGIDVEVRHGDIFSHQREAELPHIFFLDLIGICAFSDYDVQFGEFFQNETIREGDCLLITSHLGHNPGWNKVRGQFNSEFAILGIDDTDDSSVRSMFRRAHPSMTLFKGLCRNQLQSEIAISCFGAVKYKDTTPMGIYGYDVAEGRTELRSFISSVGENYFDGMVGGFCAAESF